MDGSTPPIYPPPVRASKKSTGKFSAAGAALGGRTLQTGQSRWFVGDQKHTLRWWRHDSRLGVWLIPLIRGVRPGHVSAGGRWVPRLHYCQGPWAWCPPVIVADRGSLAAEAKRRCRERGRVAVLTKRRRDRKRVAPYVTWKQAACAQGQPLTWLGDDGWAGEHWLGAGPQPELCGRCGEAARCPRPFAYRPERHETLLGLLPLASARAQGVWQQVRPGIEPAQSSEKNQLGLGPVFCNRLRLTGALGLLADAAVLLGARALLERPVPRPLLAGLRPVQLPLELAEEVLGSFSADAHRNPQNPQ